MRKWWVAALLVAVGLGGMFGCASPKYQGQDPMEYSPAFFRELAQVCSGNAATCHSFTLAVKNGTASRKDAIVFGSSAEKTWRNMAEMFINTKMPPKEEK